MYFLKYSLNPCYFIGCNCMLYSCFSFIFTQLTHQEKQERLCRVKVREELSRQTVVSRLENDSGETSLQFHGTHIQHCVLASIEVDWTSTDVKLSRSRECFGLREIHLADSSYSWKETQRRDVIHQSVRAGPTAHTSDFKVQVGRFSGT